MEEQKNKVCKYVSEILFEKLGFVKEETYSIIVWRKGDLIITFFKNMKCYTNKYYVITYSLGLIAITQELNKAIQEQLKELEE